MNRAQNFFKHADRDRDDVLDFNPEVTAFCLFDCADMYQKLTGRNLREAAIFLVWFGLKYPDLLVPGPFANMFEDFRGAAGGTLDKRFFRSMIALPYQIPNTD